MSTGIGDSLNYSKANKLWGKEVKSDQRPTNKQLALKSLFHYLQYQYWMVDEYKNIQTLINSFTQIKSQLYLDDVKSKYLVYIGLQRLVLSILRMASNVASRDLNNIRIQSQNYLFGDAFTQNERRRIINLLNMLAEQNNILEKATLEPSYFDELVEIVNRTIINSLHATKMLQHLDVIIMDYIIAPTGNIERTLGASYSTDAIVLIKRIATFSKRAQSLKKVCSKNLNHCNTHSAI